MRIHLIEKLFWGILISLEVLLVFGAIVVIVFAMILANSFADGLGNLVSNIVS